MSTLLISFQTYSVGRLLTPGKKVIMASSVLTTNFGVLEFTAFLSLISDIIVDV